MPLWVYEPPASRFAGPLSISPWRGRGKECFSKKGRDTWLRKGVDYLGVLCCGLSECRIRIEPLETASGRTLKSEVRSICLMCWCFQVLLCRC